MDDSGFMRVLQPARRLNHPVDGLLGGNRACLNDLSRKIRAVHVFHDQIAAFAFGAGVESSDNIRVRQAGDRLHLLLEPRGRVVQLRGLNRENLDRDLPVQLRISRQIDDPHPAAAQLADHLVITNLRWSLSSSRRRSLSRPAGGHQLGWLVTKRFGQQLLDLLVQSRVVSAAFCEKLLTLLRRLFHRRGKDQHRLGGR